MIKPGITGTILVTFCSLIIIACSQGLVTTNNFVDRVAALSGHGGEIARHDAFDEAKTLADSLSRTQPKTEQEIIFHYEASDFIRFLDDRNLLVGAIEVGSYLGVPNYGPIILYDLSTGQPKWFFEREDLPNGQYFLLSTEPRILIFGDGKTKSTLTALDPGTGSKIWRYSEKKPNLIGLYPAQDKAFVYSGSDKFSQVTAVGLSAGSIVWQTELLAKMIEINKGKQ